MAKSLRKKHGKLTEDISSEINRNISYFASGVNTLERKVLGITGVVSGNYPKVSNPQKGSNPPKAALHPPHHTAYAFWGGDVNPRRTKTQIYLAILRSVQRADGRLKKTHIVYKANLTHKRLDEYLEFLLANEFLAEEKKGRRTVYVITEKGKNFLSEVNKLKNISDAFGIPLY